MPSSRATHGTIRPDLPTAPATIETDYAPAFSPDGQRVAYLRAANTVEFFQGFAQYRPVSVAIRMVNLDGTGDHLVLPLAAGIFSSQLSWSPDGQQIAFDTGNQPVPKPLELGHLESAPGTLQLSVVNANGTNPHLLHGVSAGLPAWRPAIPSSPPTLRLTARLTQAAQPSIVLSWPAQTGNVTVETSHTLGATPNWSSVELPIVTESGQSWMTIPLQTANGYFRLRQP